MTERMRALYGASPLHLLAHLIALPLVAFALLKILDGRSAMRIVVWLVASAVVHDLLLLPFYGTLDRAGQRVTGAVINFVRVPALLSALLLLVYLPVILGKGAGTFTRVSGLAWTGYLARWLIITAVLFAVSAALYFARGRRGDGSRS